MPFPARDESLDAIQQINAVYRDEMKRPETTGLHIDMEGLAVWPSNEYVRHRLNGLSHTQAVKTVCNEIRRIVGLPIPQEPIDKHYWRGNFLAFQGFEFAFMYPAWSDAKRRAFRTAYSKAGHTHLPLSPYAKYGNHGQYDFSEKPEQFKAIIDELRADNILTCVMIFTDGFANSHPRSRSELQNWASWYVPRLGSSLELAATGWEFNEINGSEWTGNGIEHIRWARFLKPLLPEGCPLYVHFSPERITGWPNYPNHDGPQDEAGWWREVGNAVDGILYQRRPTEDEQYVIVHTIGGISEDGSFDIGDAQRITRSWTNKKFIFFEHSRDGARWHRLVDRIKIDARVSGYC